MLTISHFVNWVPCEVFAVAFVAFVLGTRMRIWARIGWTIILAICCAKFWMFGAFGGNRHNPVLPALIILVLNVMFSWAAGIAVVGLVWWHRKTRLWAVPVVAALLAVIGNWNGLCLPEVREVRLVYPISGKFLYVSPGCGQCAWLPIRILDPSELTVFVLARE